MPRYVDPATVYFHQGLPVSGGRLFFFESGTVTAKQTFNDDEETTENTDPVILDAGGRVPNINFSGSAKVRLRTSLTPPNGQDADALVFERDPVGGQSQLGNFSDYSALIIYSKRDRVNHTDGKSYESLTDANQDNNPVTDNGVNWKFIDFVNRLWAIGATYSIGDKTFGSNGDEYISKTDTNISNDPVNDGAVNWRNLTNEQVIVHTVSGTLTAGGEINQFRDSGAFTMPLANSVENKTICVFELPDTFTTSTPTVTVSGTDLFRDKIGTDTVILFAGQAIVTATSDGFSEWSI